jgi:hypothetical protein
MFFSRAILHQVNFLLILFQDDASISNGSEATYWKASTRIRPEDIEGEEAAATSVG